MFAFEFTIWKGVYHGINYSHVVARKVIVHAMSMEKAEKKVVLERGENHEPHYNTKTEYIYNNIYNKRKIGTVTIQRFYVYSDSGYKPMLIKQVGGKSDEL